MPERVWLYEAQHKDVTLSGIWLAMGPPEVTPNYIQIGGPSGVPYVPESRLREVEAERDALKEELDNGGAGQVSVVWVGGDEWHDEWCAWYKPEEWPLGSHRAASAFIAQKVATLRAERECLVPLARVGLFLRDKLLAGVTNTDLREHFVWCMEEWAVAIDGEDTPRTTQARAILAREAGE